MATALIDPTHFINEQLTKGFKFPSVHIQSNEQNSAQFIETVEKEKLAQSIVSQGRKRVDQRGPGSTATAELHQLQNFSPTDDGGTSARKVERERRSFDPMKGK